MHANASTAFHGRLPSGSTSPAPRITPYLPKEPNGLGLLVFPGGGYQGRAEHEGKGYAEWFAARGVTCFVVEYRVGPDGFKHPAMLEDALAAMAAVRERAETWGLRRLGVIGSSAGGHLAAMALTAYGRYPSAQNLRPDFGILCYPVILTRGDLAHAGSRNNLLGPNPTDAQIDAVSPAQLVGPDTPPCFLWHTGEDTSVPMENSLAFAAALRKHGVPHALHLIPKGRHGLGLAADFPWADEALRWMRGLES